MRRRWTYGAGALVLLALASSARAQTSETIVVDGSTGVMPLVAALARAYQAQYPGTTMQMGKGLGTTARLQALVEGTIDIALASHGLVATELARQSMAAHEIAKVAVVFGVGAGVATANITAPQLCDIYAGTITNWQALGGPDLPIAPRTRPDSEVDAEVVRAKIACLKSLKLPDTVKVMPRSGDMAKELATTAGAIGMTTTTVVEQSQGKIKLLSLDGVVPSAENVERGLYTLTRDSFLVTKAPARPAVARFVEFVRSPAGAAVIVANGGVPVK